MVLVLTHELSVSVWRKDFVVVHHRQIKTEIESVVRIDIGDLRELLVRRQIADAKRF